MPKWTCPNCDHTRIAPAALRMDDVRKYCLDCSKKTGRLVPRVWLAKERAAKKRAERREEKRAVKALAPKPVEDSAAKYRVFGVDLYPYLVAFWALPSIREARQRGVNGNENNDPRRWRPRIRIPQLNLRHGSSTLRRMRVSGYAYYAGGPITMTIGSAALIDDVIVTLLHEVVHAALPGGYHHNAAYWAYFKQAAEEYWDIKIGPLQGSKFEKHQIIYKAVLNATRVRDLPTDPETTTS